MELQNELSLAQQYEAMCLRDRAAHRRTPPRLQTRSQAAARSQQVQGGGATPSTPTPTPRERDHPAPPQIPGVRLETTTAATNVNGQASNPPGRMEIDTDEVLPPQAGMPDIDNTEVSPPRVVKKEDQVYTGEAQGSKRLAKLGEDLKDIKSAILRLEIEVRDARAKLYGEDNCFADDEDDGEDDSGGHNGASYLKKKTNTGKRSKPAWVNELHRNIRFHTKFLMDREDRLDPLPDPPSRETVEKFNEGDVTVGPSMVNFVVDLLATSASPWNDKVAKIFTKDFLASGWYKCKNKEEIKKRFKTHLDSLLREYKNSQIDTDDAARIRRQAASHRHRKLQLYYRRLRSAKVHPDLRRHVPALQALGVDGMSSDDSCWEDGRPIYNVRKKEWRSTAVTLWLRCMDAVHLNLRATGTGRVMRGNWPHERRDTSIVSLRNAVERLPRNFYSSEWLSSLTPDAIEDLDPRKNPHDLTHSEKVTQIASTWRGVHTSSMVPHLA